MARWRDGEIAKQRNGWISTGHVKTALCTDYMHAVPPPPTIGMGPCWGASARVRGSGIGRARPASLSRLIGPQPSDLFIQPTTTARGWTAKTHIGRRVSGGGRVSGRRWDSSFSGRRLPQIKLNNNNKACMYVSLAAGQHATQLAGKLHVHFHVTYVPSR